MVTFYHRLPKFDYLKPSSIPETLGLLAQHKNAARIMAGGTDIVPRLKQRLCNAPKYMLDLKKIPDLGYIRYEKTQGQLKIGALATIHDVESSSLVLDKFPVLAAAAATMASTQVRNRGTIAGNICNATPSADSAPALLVLSAKVKVVNEKGVRIINLENFFTGSGQTVLMAEDLLQEIQVPDMPAGGRGCYIKLSPRQSMDLAVVGVAVMVVADRGICRDIRIALGAVSPTPIRAKKAEMLLRGRPLTIEAIKQAAGLAVEDCKPISDHRASAEYRKEMVAVLTARAIEQAIAG